MVLEVKNPPANQRDLRDRGLIPGSGRSRVGHGNSLQYSCLENCMDRGAWRALLHGATQSQIRTKPPRSCLPLLWSPPCFYCESSSASSSSQLLTLKNLEEAGINTSMMRVTGDLSPLHSTTGSQLTKVTIPGGSLLREAARPQEAAGSVIIFYRLAEV